MWGGATCSIHTLWTCPLECNLNNVFCISMISFPRWIICTSKKLELVQTDVRPRPWRYEGQTDSGRLHIDQQFPVYSLSTHVPLPRKWAIWYSSWKLEQLHDKVFFKLATKKQETQCFCSRLHIRSWAEKRRRLVWSGVWQLFVTVSKRYCCTNLEFQVIKCRP